MSAELDAKQILSTVWSPGYHGPDIRLPVEPFLIAQRLGLKAFSAVLDGGISGMLIKREGEDAEIYVQASDSPNRQRFTCAHELGHYFKRSSAGDEHWSYVEHRNLLTSAGTDPEEIYANKFAAGLLMPGETVKELWKIDQNPVTLAYRFGVSSDAMNFRLTNLKLPQYAAA